jgi:hypothetical protein
MVENVADNNRPHLLAFIHYLLSAYMDADMDNKKIRKYAAVLGYANGYYLHPYSFICLIYINLIFFNLCLLDL